MAVREETFNPGTMRHVVALQQPTITRGADGGEIKTYPDTATIRAEVAFGSGREFFAAKSVDADLTHTLTIRYYPGLGPDWRVKFVDPIEGTTRYFDVRSIQALGTMRRYQMLMCRELVGLVPES